MQYQIDTDKLQKAMFDSGYSSVAELAKSLGLHRNSLYGYFNGKLSAFNSSIEMVFKALEIEPFEVITKVGYDLSLVADLLDSLIQENSSVCYVLFGSRASGTHKRFSDFDIGVFSQANIGVYEYSKLLDISEDLSEDLPVEVDLVDLSAAEQFFLDNIILDSEFLGGSFKQWINFKKRQRY